MGPERSRPRLLTVLGLICIFVVFLGVYKIGQSTGSNQQDQIRTTLAVDGTAPEYSVETVEILSWSPRAFLFRGLLTPEECDHIIDIGSKHLERSMVVGRDGKPVVNPARSSYGTFLSQFMKDPVIRKVEERIEKWTMLPREHGEVFYLLRYENGQEYKAHTDWFHKRGDGGDHLGRAGQRIATVLTYLSEVEEGGETFFPRINVEVKPHKGDALLFWNLTPDHTEDEMALHGSKPVTKDMAKTNRLKATPLQTTQSRTQHRNNPKRPPAKTHSGPAFPL